MTALSTLPVLPTAEPPDAAVAGEALPAVVAGAGGRGGGAPARLNPAVVTRAVVFVVEVAAPCLLGFCTSVGPASGAIAFVLLAASRIAALRIVSAGAGWDRT